tara:strand:- start:531 stop:1058 length:528 start_codon:yes stop_codon:yes gene_type:complete
MNAWNDGLDFRDNYDPSNEHRSPTALDDATINYLREDMTNYDGKQGGNPGHRSQAYCVVADDEESVRGVISDVLKLRDYSVEKASNGMEALDKVRAVNGEVDIVLTDIRMPEMSGLELLDSLAGEYPEIPVVLISGSPEDLVEYAGDFPTNYNGFLKKPFRIEDLEGMVDKVLNK